jgi:hypothetical protein
VKSRIGDYKIQALNNTSETYNANSQLATLVDQEPDFITEQCAHRIGVKLPLSTGRFFISGQL